MTDHIATARALLVELRKFSFAGLADLEQCIADAERWRELNEVRGEPCGCAICCASVSPKITVKFFDAEGKEIIS